MQHLPKQHSEAGITQANAGGPGEATETNKLKPGSRGGSMQSIIRHFRRTGVFLILATMAHALPAHANQPKIVPLDVPGATATTVGGISAAGDVTGFYILKTNNHYYYFGFLRTKDGRFTSFDAPPPGGDINIAPRGVAMNTAGEVTGNYGRFLGEDERHKFYTDAGFLRLADNTVIDISPPDSYTSTPYAINAQGTVVGTYGGNDDGVYHFYLRAADGAFTTIDPPALGFAIQLGINAAGAVTGCYYDTDGNIHSFLRTVQGAIATFDVPGADQGTQAVSINPAGDIAGYYYDADYVPHGFLRTQNGQFTTFDPQGSTGTVVVGITPAGAITGNHTDADGVSHGFLRTQNGQFTTIDPHGATYTTVTGINPAGTITGSYEDAAHFLHGFVY